MRDYKLKCRENVIVRASGLGMRSLERIASASKIAKQRPFYKSKDASALDFNNPNIYFILLFEVDTRIACWVCGLVAGMPPAAYY
ncbi:MAG: hypothetical protein ACT6FG_07630 [Methanosarcinaceae archaeon]